MTGGNRTRGGRWWWGAVALWLGSCAGGIEESPENGPGEEPTEPPIVTTEVPMASPVDAGTADAGPPADGAAVAEATPPAAPPRCRVQGRATIREPSAVVPDGRPIRFASLTGTLSAELPERREAIVTVTHPIAVELTTRSPLPVAFARPLDLANGMVHVAPATPIERVVQDETGIVRADVALADGVSIRGLEVPCNALELSDVLPPLPPEGAEEGLVARSGRLSLARTPEGEVELTVILRRAREVALSSTGTADAHVRVWRSFESGASFNGWAGGRDLSPITRPIERRPVAESLVHERVENCLPPAAGFYRGPARVAPGTEVHVTAGGATWARTAERDVAVRTLPDREWVAIETVRGVKKSGRCADVLDFAFVPRASVTFPQGAPVAGGVPE